MKKVCNTLQMKELEKKAESMGIIPLLLMENASLAVANYLKKITDIKNKKILVVCGRGNNGGDGMAVARHLYNSGADVNVLLVDGNKNFSKETEANFNILKNLGIKITLTSETMEKIDTLFISSEIIVDALFGTGLTREVAGIYKELIEKMNDSKKFILSIDIPSGVNSDTGEIMGVAVRANATVALGYLKLGHLLFPGREYCGDLEVTDISLSCQFITSYYLIDEEERFILRKRKLNTHKGTYGHMVVIGGSIGKTGAVMMSAKAGLRAGAGLVTIVCPEDLNIIMETLSLEVMTLPLKGSFGYLSANYVGELEKFLLDKECVVLGPGLGYNERTINFFETLLSMIKSPVVIDADGLNCLSANKDLLKGCRYDVVLTPHPGEMSRLIGKDVTYVLKNPVDSVVWLAKEYKCHVVLKGSTTVYSDPLGRVYFSIYGNPGMATAGSGDVLSGIIGSFIAQKYEVRESILLSLLLHGMAGNLAKDMVGEYALNATDIISAVPVVLKKWEVKNGC